MKKIANFSAANAALATYYPSQITRKAYTLDYMSQLLDFLGNPQESFRIVHVAGTSGKTSTCYYAAAMLQAAGLRVGLTVSPHVTEINDRVQIDGRPLDEAMFCAELESFLQLVEQSGVQPSYFELMVAFAFWEFKRQRVDYAVVEVGLGGLLDATNSIARQDKTCIITDIGLDHTAVLGNTLGAIAEQKAGIIQHSNTVFCYQQAPEIMKPIQARARQKQADLHTIQPVNTVMAGAGAALPLFQQRNFSLARATVEYVLQQDDHVLTEAMVAKAFQVQVPARMEVFRIGNKQVILDGAHNGQKLTALTASIKQQFPDEPIAAMLAFVAGRETEARMHEGLAVLVPQLSYIITTQFSGAQDAPHTGEQASVVTIAAKAAGASEVRTVPDAAEAFTTLLARPEKVLLVAGSFYLLNHIRPLALKMTTADKHA